MSFFGFDPTHSRGRGHPTNAPGFSNAADPFEGLSRGRQDGLGGDNDDAIDFEETYDGLGDQLDETDDAFNDDTFGGEQENTIRPVGKDFDFFGSTAKVSDALSEEQMRFTRTQAPPKSVATFASYPQKQPAKPARTGYEKYKNLDHVSDLQVDPSLWGSPSYTTHTQSLSSQSQSQPSQISAAKKMLSLEEVEEQMRQMAKGQTLQTRVPPSAAYPSDLRAQQAQHPSSYEARTSSQHYDRSQPPMAQAELPATQASAPRIIHRQQESGNGDGVERLYKMHEPRSGQNDASTHSQGAQHQHSASGSGLSRLPPHSQIITHPQQIIHLSEEDRTTFLIEDAKRAKRNHKIFLLSKDNGLMTPQDKNFITRIQLQQLMAATGSTNEQDTDAVLSEDFYYQVLSQIRGGPRQNPQQPLSHFAQTYLFQTGGRHGAFNRRHNRGGDNHMQRMEQQVQRAVEAAKLRPKNQQITVEGSLGKISLSNAKAPRAVLNVKRQDPKDASAANKVGTNIPSRPFASGDKKSILRDLENVYSALMRIEDTMRDEPVLPPGDPDPAAIEAHLEWRDEMKQSNDHLWKVLKVLEPIDQSSSVPHPFIAMLSYSKGKKVVPRVFRHLNSEQRITVLTMIVLHLDILDVVRSGQVQPGESHLPAAAREAIDLFSAAVTPSLFAYVSEAPLFNVIGLLSLILDRVNVPAVVRTMVGLSILTMLASRATLVKEAGEVENGEWQQWQQLYNRLFDSLEPILPSIFPGSVNSGEDMYVWQFLAAIGSGASPEQQQRLVIAVKDRVMETVTSSKTLPPDMSSQRLGNVNLFMRAIGLDVELLE